jgi:hypothetical protein
MGRIGIHARNGNEGRNGNDTPPKNFLFLFSVLLHKNENIPGVLTTHVLVPISTHPTYTD